VGDLVSADKVFELGTRFASIIEGEGEEEEGQKKRSPNTTTFDGREGVREG